MQNLTIVVRLDHQAVVIGDDVFGDTLLEDLVDGLKAVLQLIHFDSSGMESRCHSSRIPTMNSLECAILEHDPYNAQAVKPVVVC